MGCGCSKTSAQNGAVVPFDDGSSRGRKKKKRKTNGRRERQSQRNDDSTEVRSSSSSSPPNGGEDGPTVTARGLRSPRSPQAAGKRKKRKRRGVPEKERDVVGTSGSPTASTSGQHEVASDPDRRTGSVAQGGGSSEAIHGGKEKAVVVQIVYPGTQQDGVPPQESGNNRHSSRTDPKKKSSSRQASPRHSPRQPSLGQEQRPHTGVVVASEPPAENPLAGPLQNSPTVPPDTREKDPEKSVSSSVGISVANSSRPGMSRAKVMRVQAWIDAAAVTDLLDPQEIVQQIQREQLALNFMQQSTGLTTGSSVMTGSTTSARTVKASQFRGAYSDNDVKNTFVPLVPRPSPQAVVGEVPATQQRTPPQVSAFVEHQPSAEFLLPGGFEGSDTSAQLPLRPGSPNPDQPSTSVRTNADPIEDFASPR
jgi:hypothetical protein